METPVRSVAVKTSRSASSRHQGATARGESRKKTNKSSRRDTARPQLLAPWQRRIIWTVWLLSVWLLWRNTVNTGMGAMEFAGLAVAITVTVLCKKYPQGGRAVAIDTVAGVHGEFESCTNWALVLFGAALLLGGIASTVRVVTHLATGFATVGDIFRDMGVFVAGWVQELFLPLRDAELEKTQAYILCVLILPGLLVTWLNLLPLLYRGRAFRVTGGHGLSVQDGDGWAPVPDRAYAQITADGISIDFRTKEEDPLPSLRLPMDRVFNRETNTRVPSRLLAARFRHLLEQQGYTVTRRTAEGMAETSWIARRNETSA